MTVGSGGCSIGEQIKTINVEVGNLDVTGTPIATIRTSDHVDMEIPNNTVSNFVCKINNKVMDITTIPVATYSSSTPYVNRYTLTEPYSKTIATDFIPGTIYRIELITKQDNYPYTSYMAYRNNYTVDANGNLTIDMPIGTIYRGMNATFIEARYYQIS